jgi:ribokinase
MVFVGREEHEAPGFLVKAKDTTGAGDCFVGGLLAAIHHGHNYSQAARIANAVGAMNVENLGAAQGVRSWEETQTWMRERDNL